MGIWGKLLGGVAGFAMGGPFGAVMGAALGHSVDQGQGPRGFAGQFGGVGLNPARMAALLGGRDQVFAICVVVLSAKLAKCDGAVSRSEIDAFKRQFRIPPEGVRNVGRLFDQARDSPEGFEEYARQLAHAFADNRGLLEDVLAALFAIARADKPLTVGEEAFLRRTHRLFELDDAAWDRAQGGATRPPADEVDAYEVLGVSRADSDEALRQAWKQLVRENHPDTLASRGVPPEFVARASDKVARINAAWDPHQAGTPAVTLRVQEAPSPNQDDRPVGPIDMLILHYTGMKSGQAALDRLRDPEARVSSHYLVEEDGTLFRLVPEGRRAWHAGVSCWRGHTLLNGRSIGIEIVNPGHEWGYRAFPAAQMQAVRALCLGVLSRNPIPARNVLAHSDVAPDRKTDPGELFDWRGLAADGIGLWPDGGPDPGTLGAVEDAAALRPLRQALAAIGYQVASEGGHDAALASVLRAFQRHWRPEAVTGGRPMPARSHGPPRSPNAWIAAEIPVPATL